MAQMCVELDLHLSIRIMIADLCEFSNIYKPVFPMCGRRGEVESTHNV